MTTSQDLVPWFCRFGTVHLIREQVDGLEINTSFYLVSCTGSTFKLSVVALLIILSSLLEKSNSMLQFCISYEYSTSHTQWLDVCQVLF